MTIFLLGADIYRAEHLFEGGKRRKNGQPACFWIVLGRHVLGGEANPAERSRYRNFMNIPVETWIAINFNTKLLYISKRQSDCRSYIYVLRKIFYRFRHGARENQLRASNPAEIDSLFFQIGCAGQGKMTPWPR